jgi:hypothetical protein
MATGWLAYYRRWLASAFWHGWGRAESVASAIGLLAPPLLKLQPGLKGSMEELAWQIPLAVLASLALTRLVAAPYLMYRELEDQKSSLESERDRLRAGPDLPRRLTLRFLDIVEPMIPPPSGMPITETFFLRTARVEVVNMTDELVTGVELRLEQCEPRTNRPFATEDLPRHLRESGTAKKRNGCYQIRHSIAPRGRRIFDVALKPTSGPKSIHFELCFAIPNEWMELPTVLRMRPEDGGWEYYRWRLTLEVTGDNTAPDSKDFILTCDDKAQLAFRVWTEACAPT